MAEQRILITHLTRMGVGYICVAGITPDGDHIRPVRRSMRWTRAHAHPNGPFRIGTVVHLGELQHTGQPPELEDRLVVTERNIAVNKRLTPVELWHQLRRVCANDLTAAFGDELVPTGRRRAYVPESRGTASLGCIRLPDARLHRTASGNPRVTFTDPKIGALDLSLTDLRAHDSDNTPIDDVLAMIDHRFEVKMPVLACVGLSRALVTDNHPTGHWLQVNNLHFQGDLDLRPI